MYDQIDYSKNVRQLSELINQAAEKKLAFFRHVQLVTVSALAILVAFLQNVNSNLYLRILFATAILILSLAILTTGIAIYNLTNLVEKTRKKYQSELEKAINEEREMEILVAVDETKISIFAQKCAYILLLLALLHLSSFAIISLLFNF